jgi:voltage-gated potassium channel
MEEITIPKHSAFSGETLVTSGFRKEIGVIIVGIKKHHGTMVFNPHSQTKIEGGDTLIVLGEPDSIAKLEDLVDRSPTDEVIKKHRKDQANAH